MSDALRTKAEADYKKKVEEVHDVIQEMNADFHILRNIDPAVMTDEELSGMVGMLENAQGLGIMRIVFGAMARVYKDKQNA